MLIQNGFSFNSETDTEVIVNLISHFTINQKMFTPLVNH